MAKEKILIVEDELLIAMDLKSSLEHMGYFVPAMADTGKEAIKKAEECLPDLIMMDIMLREEMDGIEAARQIRSHLDIPVIFLTAFQDDDILERAKLTDPFGYMIKPFDDHSLRINIEVTLLKHKLETQLRQAKEKAEAATELKDKFVSLVAHDLKAPLVSIQSFLKLIHDDDKTPPSREHKEFIEIVMNSSKRMQTMITEILTMANLQTGSITPKFRFLDGRSVAETILVQLNQLGRDKDVRLRNEIPEETRVYADSNLFHEVLLNLVSNAIKYSNAGGEVTIFVPPEKTATIAVKDIGTGVNENVLPDIFKQEVKTSTPGTKGEQGTGFGLPLSHDIMKAHGGTLTVESSKGKGSVFHANLPDVHPRVLIVEDSLIIRRELRKILKTESMEIEEAENGKEALTKMEQEKPHLVLLDLLMPVMDGFEVLKRLKNDAEFKGIPVLVLTGHGSMENRERAYQLGADDLITKPTTAEELIPRIRKFIYLFSI